MSDPTVFSWSILDDEGLSNTISMYVAYDGLTATQDELVNAWLAYGALADAIIDGQITGGAITIPLTPDGAWKAAPVNGNNVNQVMNLNFNNDFNSYATSILLPSYKESILTPTHKPDLADAGLAAFITATLVGEPPVTPAVFPNSRDLHDLNALRDAFLTVRKVRNQKRGTIATP
jgi:hypothetical protein